MESKLASKVPHVCPMSGRNHSPSVVSRCGGASPEELNICGICGDEMTKIRGRWIAITGDQSDSIRKANG